MQTSLLVLLLLLLVGCSTSRRYGDAKVTEYPNTIAFTRLPSFELPKFDVSRRDDHRFSITNLPRSGFPRRLVILSRNGVEIHRERLVVNLAIVSAGQTILKCRLNGRDRNGFELSKRDQQAMESLTSYDVHLKVVAPVSAPGVRAQFIGPW